VVAPCTAPYFQELGFVSLAAMAFSSFLLIGTLLLMDRAYDLGSMEDVPEEPDVPEADADPAGLEAGRTPVRDTKSEMEHV
jgi:hypothetical protein